MRCAGWGPGRIRREAGTSATPKPFPMPFPTPTQRPSSLGIQWRRYWGSSLGLQRCRYCHWWCPLGIQCRIGYQQHAPHCRSLTAAPRRPQSRTHATSLLLNPRCTINNKHQHHQQCQSPPTTPSAYQQHQQQAHQQTSILQVLVTTSFTNWSRSPRMG